ncbi:MAG: hypothetical protein ACK5MR_17115, partial [Cumulibacter sp.]
LDHADALRAKRRQVLTHLDALDRALFHHHFGLPNTWRDRWPVSTIGDLSQSVAYGTASKAHSTGTWPILRMGNITDDGRLDLRDLKYIDLNEAETQKYSVRRGDLLFNRTNSLVKVGKSAVIRTERPLAFCRLLASSTFRRFRNV